MLSRWPACFRAQGTCHGVAPERAPPDREPAGDPVDRYLHELGEGYRYVRENRRVLLIGIAWALFVAAMMTQGVLSAPLSERILHGGAVGYGWLNAGWAVGAFLSVFYASGVIRRHGAHRVVTVTMSLSRHRCSSRRCRIGWRWLCPSTS